MRAEELTLRLSGLLASVPKVLFGILLLFPVVVGLFQLVLGGLGLRPEDILIERANPLWVLAYVLARTDSGAQLPSGSALYHFLVTAFLITWLLLPRPFPPLSRRAAGWGAAALCAALASALLSTQMAAAVGSWFSLLLFFLLMAAALSLNLDPRFWPWIATIFRVGGGLVILTALAMEALYGAESPRLSGSFHHPNIFGAFVLLAFPHFLQEEKPYLRYLGTGWLVLGVLLGRVLWSHRKQFQEHARGLVLAVLLCVSFFLVLYSGSISRWSKGVESGSFQARTAFWSAALAMSLEKPPLGLGGEAFRRYFPQYQKDSRYFSKFAHCLPLSWAADWGWFFVVLMLVGARSGWPGQDEARKPWLCGALAFFLHACLDVHDQFPALMGWFAVSVACAWTPPAQANSGKEAKQRSAWSVRPGLLLQYLALMPLMCILMYFLLSIYGSHYAAVAQLAARLQKPQQARELFLEASRLCPWESDYFRQASQVLVGDKQEISEEVLEDARRALALDPHRAVNHNVWGRLQELAGLDGRGALSRALELDPVNYPSFYTHLAEAYMARRQNAEALKVALDGWQRFPLRLVTQVNSVRVDELRAQLSDLGLVTSYLLLDVDGELARAERTLRATLFLRPGLREAELALALVLHRSHRESKAVEMLQELAKRHPDWDAPAQILETLPPETQVTPAPRASDSPPVSAPASLPTPAR